MSTVQLKSSTTLGNIPLGLTQGEVAINLADEIFFYKNSSGVTRAFGLPAPLEMQTQLGLQINGGMEFDRQNSGSAVAIPNSSLTYVVDQWQFGYVHTANSAVFSANQSSISSLGNNLNNGLRSVSTTALTIPGTGDYALFQQPIEGYRLERMNFGLSNAMPLSIGIWIFATATGTGSYTIRNSAFTRSYVSNFTITSSNTWQWVPITIPGDITGTWLTGFNTGIVIGFCFCCGATYQTTAGGGWVSGNFMGTSANTNFFSSNGNVVVITGLTILPGANMPPVARTGMLLRSSDEELRLVMRYWERGNQPLRNMPFGLGVTQASDIISYMAPKRVTPSINMTGFQYYSNGVPSLIGTLSLNNIYQDHFEFVAQGLTNWQGWFNTGIWTANARM